jgi:hypothetical protein
MFLAFGPPHYVKYNILTPFSSIKNINYNRSEK